LSVSKPTQHDNFKVSILKWHLRVQRLFSSTVAAMAEPPEVLDLATEAPVVKMFTINAKKYPLERALDKLRDMKRSSNKSWWGSLEICTTGEGAGREPRLKCTHCNKLLTVSNPKQSADNHLTTRACKGLKRLGAAEEIAAAAAAAAASDTRGGGSAAGGSSSASPAAIAAAAVEAALLGKRKRTGMFASATQQENFEKSLARFFFKNGIPLQLTDDPDLKAAAAHVGLIPPNRYELSNKLLDQVYEEVRAADLAKLAAQPLLQVSTDGWRRRTAVRGVPLINIMALLPPGGSVFFKVVAAPGVVKDKQWIKDRHLEWAALVTEGNLERMLGMVMDNTKANM
jgi:hypothetical protein